MNKLTSRFITIKLFILSLFALSAFSADKVDWTTKHKYIKVDEKRINAILAEMSLNRKIAQVIMPERRYISPKDLGKYQFGGMLNGGGSFPNNYQKASVQDWVDELQAYHIVSSKPLKSGQIIPVLWGTDAVHGHNNVHGAVLYPHNIALGASKDADLLRRIGKATAKEVAATGIFWTFAPALPVVQDLTWGRSYEGFGEDPQLVAKLGAANVEGFQGEFKPFLDDSRVIATAKHFIGDGGTRDGVDQGNTAVSEKQLRDVHGVGYFSTFEVGVQTVMATFNSWNGEKIHGHKYLLTEVLKNQMSFDGFVVGDWNGHGQVSGCTNDNCAQAFNAGVDMFMVPENWQKLYQNLIIQVKKGVISKQRLDDAVRRILRVKMRLGLLDGASPEKRAAATKGAISSKEHIELAAEAAKKSAVLLKNNNSLLPLSGNKHYLVVGKHAKDVGTQMGGWSITWQGTETSNADYPNALSYYDAIAAYVKKQGGTIEFSEDGSYTKKPAVALVVYGETPYAEGPGDRQSLDLSDEQSGLKALTKLQANGIATVSIFLSGRPLWVNPELNASTAFIAAWWSGTRAGAIADLIFCKNTKKCDFTGKLSFAWPSMPANNSRVGTNALFAVNYGLSLNDDTQLEQFSSEFKADIAPRLLFKGRALEGFKAEIQSSAGNKYAITNKKLKSKDGSIKGQVIDLTLQEDGVALEVKTKNRAAFIIESTIPRDFSIYENGFLEFAVQPIKINKKATVNLSVICGETACRNVTMPISKILSGKKVKKYAIAMQCFKKAGFNFKYVTHPFVLSLGGKAKLNLGEVRYTAKQSNSELIECQY